MHHTRYNAEEKLWSGNNIPTIYNPKASIGHIVLDALKRNPEKVIQVSDDTGSQLTAGECRLKTIRAAQNLQRLGYKSNDVFGFMTNNHHSLAPIVYAALCLGCPINPLAASYEESEIVHMFGITKPVVIFCDDICYEALKRSLDKLGGQAKIIVLDANRENTTNVDELFAKTGSESTFIATNVDAENHIAAILCSSGTTGLPKGVSVTHAALMDLSTNALDLSGDDIIFTFTLLFWITGLFMTVSSPILGFKRIITTKSFSPEYLLNLIEKYKITMVPAASLQVILMSKCASIENADLSSVKNYISAGGAVSASVIERMNKLLSNGQIVIAYGLSEIGFITANETKSTNSNEHCGSLRNGLEVKIIDKAGKRLGVNEDGELCVKSSIKLLGYYKNPTATQELFDEEGFLLTGDVGHFDQNGYLHLVDRKKDIFKCSFAQISPSEIEDVLLRAPAISSACVVGIPNEFTHLTAAVVVKRQGYDISKEQIHEFLSTRLPKTKQLFGGIYFVDSLPLTPSGKIIRREVLKIATDLFNKHRKNDQ